MENQFKKLGYKNINVNEYHKIRSSYTIVMYLYKNNINKYIIVFDYNMNDDKDIDKAIKELKHDLKELRKTL